MASREKAELKAAMADELLSDFEQLIAGLQHRRDLAAQVSKEYDSLMMWLREYRNRIEKAFEEDRFPAESRESVLAVFVDIVSYVNKQHRRSLEDRTSLGPFIAGVEKCSNLVEKRKSVELRRAQLSEEEELEDEEWRAEKPPSGEVAPLALVPTPEPRPEPEPEAQEEPEVEKPQLSPVRVPKAVRPEPPAAPSCAHCKDQILIDTGSKYCSACVSHRNRYKRLPSARMLKKRRSGR